MEKYLVGFTTLTADGKWRRYRAEGFDHLIILADGMDCATALQLENELQIVLMRNSRQAIYRKYHPDKRKPRRSSGGRSHKASVNCSVYMAWWDK